MGFFSLAHDGETALSSLTQINHTKIKRNPWNVRTSGQTITPPLGYSLFATRGATDKQLMNDVIVRIGAGDGKQTKPFAGTIRVPSNKTIASGGFVLRFVQTILPTNVCLDFQRGLQKHGSVWVGEWSRALGSVELSSKQ